MVIPATKTSASQSRDTLRCSANWERLIYECIRRRTLLPNILRNTVQCCSSRYYPVLPHWMDSATMTIPDYILAEAKRPIPGQSLCKRKTTICSIFLNGKCIQTVFNGTSWSARFCSNEVGNCGCMHAEVKAILLLPMNLRFLELYSLYSPCSQCANAILFCGRVKTVYYVHDTEHDMRGLQILRTGGIPCFKLPKQES